MKKSSIVKNYLKFNLIITSSFLLDLLCLFILTELFNFHYLISTILAILASSLLSYNLNKRFVFNKSKTKFHKGFPIYLAINSLKIVYVSVAMFILVDLINLHYLLSRIIISVTLPLAAYFLHTKFTFKTNFKGR